MKLILNNNIGLPEAPQDDKQYARKNANWSEVTGGLTSETDPIFNQWLNSQNNQNSGKFLISGGAIWSGTGLVYNVSNLSYYFNGNKTASSTSITLDASDATNNRFDVIVVNEAGVISKITGQATANPIVPTIPNDKLLVSIIFVEKGTLQPTVTQEVIYLDNPTTNWTFGTFNTGLPTTGTIDFSNTTSPKQGTHVLSANTDYRLGARFTKSSAFNPKSYNTLQVWVRFTGTNVDSNKSLNVSFEDASNNIIGNTVNLFNYGLLRNTLSTWQLILIPISAFGNIPISANGLRMIMEGGTLGVTRQWDIDLMLLSTIISNSTNGITVPLSSITPATTSNSIDNQNLLQEWQWNNLSDGVGLRLSTNKPVTYDTTKTQTLLEITKETSLNTLGTSILLDVNNKSNPPSGVSIGGKFRGNDYAILTGNTGLNAGFGNIGIQGNSKISWINGAYNGAYIWTPPYTLELSSPDSGFVHLRSDYGVKFTNKDGNGAPLMHFAPFGTNGYTAQEFIIGGQYNSGYGYYPVNYQSLIRNTASGLKIGHNTGTLNTVYIPIYQLNIVGSTNNVGIGTETPVTSAKLEVSSTSKGFLPPRMTASQASAIASPAEGLMLYVTDTNGTFTSKGWYGFDGSAWYKF